MALIRGRVWKFGDNINTDLMLPNIALSKPDEEQTKYCFWANRPGWAEQVQKGDIIIAGRNFGCGSSRPAARLLKALGIGVIVGDSMSRLFFRNAVNIGLPVLICDGCSQLFQEGEQARVDMETGEVTNLASGKSLKGEALPVDSPPAQILRAGGLKNLMRQESN